MPVATTIMMPMTQRDEALQDVVIVGGGLVGATLACLLRNLSLKVTLVDQTPFDSTTIPSNQPQPAFDPRVSALTAASISLLKELGLWDAVQQTRVCSYQDMQVWDADGTGSIHFSAAAINEPALGAIVENSVILAALYKQIADSQHLHVVAPFSIAGINSGQQGDESTVQLVSSDGDTLHTRLLIAADGTNSRIRQLANFPSKEWEYNHHALVTTVRTEQPHHHTALQRFMDTGPLAFLPLAATADGTDEHYCSIVWSAVPERAAALMALPEAAFNAELAAAIEHRLGKVEWSAARFAFPLNQRHATSYVQDNIVLVGDAAHTIHPLAGQGVNLGLLDVKVLAEELARGLEAGRSIADPVVLNRYQRQRRGHNLGMMWLMEAFKHLFAEKALPVRWLRNVGLKSVDNLTLVKNALTRRAMGLD